MEPAATLRGFANGSSPFSSRSRLSSRRRDFFIHTSPSTITETGCLSWSGTDSIVRTLCVTSSPITPSPRVAAVLRRPFSYVSTILSPSILCSQQYVGITLGISESPLVKGALRRDVGGGLFDIPFDNPRLSDSAPPFLRGI